tara:strand:- start:1167 stop:1877 length:711 start_codon:yes stop_codon:yes gene_type:complete
MTYTLMSTNRGLVRCPSIAAVQAERMKDLYFDLEDPGGRGEFQSRWSWACKGEKEDREIESELEFAQASEEELRACEDWCSAIQTATDVAIDGMPWWIYTYSEDINISLNNHYDLMEMNWDMCKWEEEEAQHILFAENTWDKRGDLSEKEMNKRSETNAQVKITKNGRDYLTGEHSLGKIYIPKHVWVGEFPEDLSEDDYVLADLRIRFLGFEGCRPRRKMPWRAMKMAGLHIVRH